MIVGKKELVTKFYILRFHGHANSVIAMESYKICHIY